MHKTTLEQWRMFKAVVDHGGFSQAATAVHKSQSTVHHAVHKLEEILGTRLFEVQGRKAFLTTHGELLLKRGNFLLEEVARIESVAESLGSGVETQLVVAIDEAFPQQTVHQVLHRVSEQYPLLHIEMIESVLSGSNELVEQGLADIGLSPIPMKDGLNEEICAIEFVAVAKPSHPLHHYTRRLQHDDLKAYRQIVIRDSSNERTTSDGWLGAEQRWTVSHIRTSIELVSKGLGFAWLPLPAIQDLINHEKLVPLNLQQGQRRSVTFYLNYKDEDKLGVAAKEFMGELRYKTL